MKAMYQIPSKEYPYLAVWSLDVLNDHSLARIELQDVVVVSLIEVEGSDKQPYVTPLLGGKQGYFTKNEGEYFRLPKGFLITIEQ